MMNTLVMFEFLNEVKTFFANNGRQALKQNGMNILALRPDIQSHLKKSGIPFVTSRDFFDRTSHEKLLLKSDEVVRAFRRPICIEDDMRIEEGYNNALLFYVRCFVHYMLFLVEVIDRCVEDLSIDQIIAPDYGPPFRLKPLVDREYGYLGQISRLICQNRGIAFNHFNVATQNRVQRPSALKTYEYFTGIGKKLIFGLTLRSLERGSRGKTVILSSSKDYNMSSVMEELHRIDDNIFVCYLASRNKWTDFKKTLAKKWIGNLFTLPDRVPMRKKAAFEKGLFKNTDLLEKTCHDRSDLLKYRGVDFSDQVFERIRIGLLPYLIKLYGQTVFLNRLLSRLRPKMILAPHSREITYNLGELAKHYRIPAMLISHGSHIPPKNGYEKIEWSEHGLGLIDTHYDYVAIQTPWAEAYLDGIETRSKGIKTGPLLFGKQIDRKEPKELLRKRFIPGHEDNFVILNASTPKTREVIRFYIYETVDEYISNTNDLIEAVNEMENAYLIVRFRPLPDLNEDDFARLLRPSDCYGIYSHGAFAEYLLFCDLLVSYSSTAIEEALQNEMPVLQYDSQGKYCHVPATHLKPERENSLDSCYFAGSKEDLPLALEWIARHHYQKAVPRNIFDRHIFKEDEVTPLSEVYRKFAYSSSQMQMHFQEEE